jgi:hypothetical protein
MPASVADEIARSGFKPVVLKSLESGIEMGHLFVTSRDDLAETLRKVRAVLVPGGIVWVSWPKKASGVATDVGEDEVRAAAFPLGMVDIKVCAVDETWSGLKLTIRKSERTKMPDGSC